MSHTPYPPYTHTPRPAYRGTRWYVLFVTVFLTAIASILLLSEYWRLTFSAWGSLSRAQLAARKAENALKTEAARTLDVELLRSVRNATNVLLDLLLEDKRVRAQATNLKTNEDGRVIARDSGLARTARFLFRTEYAGLPSDQEVIEHLEDARRHEWDLLQAVGTSYIPDQAFVTLVSNNLAWAKKKRALVDDVKGLFKGLARESYAKTLLTPLAPDSSTLQETFGLLDAEDAANRLKEFDDIRRQAESKRALVAGEYQEPETRSMSTNATPVSFRKTDAIGSFPRDAATNADRTINLSTNLTCGAQKKDTDALPRHLNLDAKASRPAQHFETPPIGNGPGYCSHAQLVVVDGRGVHVRRNDSQQKAPLITTAQASLIANPPAGQWLLGVDGQYHYYSSTSGR